MDRWPLHRPRKRPRKESSSIPHGKIYSNAQTVLVWLGEQHNDSNLVIDFISEVSSLSSQQNPSDPFSPYIYRGDGKYQVSAWKAIDYLFRRSYWERTWIIQEIRLAHNVHIYCGYHAFDWLAGSAFFGFRTSKSRPASRN